VPVAIFVISLGASTNILFTVQGEDSLSAYELKQLHCIMSLEWLLSDFEHIDILNACLYGVYS
jgi:hypothetical protein